MNDPNFIQALWQALRADGITLRCDGRTLMAHYANALPRVTDLVIDTFKSELLALLAADVQKSQAPLASSTRFTRAYAVEAGAPRG